MWPFAKKQAAPVEAKSLADPDTSLYELLTAGHTTGTVAVGRGTAMSVPAVAAAVRVISEAAATLDVRVMQGTEAAEHPVSTLLKGDVNDWLGGYELIRDLVAEALTHDAGGFAYVNRVSGEVREIIKYDAGRITVIYDMAGTGEPTYRLDGRLLNNADVIHLRGPLSKCPLTLCREAIGLAHIFESHAANLFSNGAKPGVVLETPQKLGDTGVKAMIAGWRAAHEGPQNTGRTAVLWEGTTAKQLALTSVDSEFTATRRYQLEEISRAFNIPSVMLNDLTKSSYANAEHKGREFLQYTLEPWLRALEGALSRALFTPEERVRYRVSFDRDDLTRADLSVRATAIASLIQTQVINSNTARDWLGLPPRAGGEEYLNPAISPANDNPSPAREAA